MDRQKQRHINKLVKNFIKRGFKYTYKKINHQKAIQMFDKAIELNPNNANAYKYRGDVYMRTDLEKAIKDYTKAIELKPNYISAYSSRAAIYYSPLVDYPLYKAIEDFLTIINYSKNFCEAYEFLGEILSANEDYESANFMLTKAIELKPTRFKYYMQRGSNYLKLQKYELAIKDFNTVLEILPNYHFFDVFTKCYKQRSEAYLQLGQKEKANIDLKLMKEAELKQKERKKIVPF